MNTATSKKFKKLKQNHDRSTAHTGHVQRRHEVNNRVWSTDWHVDLRLQAYTPYVLTTSQRRAPSRPIRWYKNKFSLKIFCKSSCSNRLERPKNVRHFKPCVAYCRAYCRSHHWRWHHQVLHFTPAARVCITCHSNLHAHVVICKHYVIQKTGSTLRSATPLQYYLTPVSSVTQRMQCKQKCLRNKI